MSETSSAPAATVSVGSPIPAPFMKRVLTFFFLHPLGVAITAAVVGAFLGAMFGPLFNRLLFQTQPPSTKPIQELIDKEASLLSSDESNAIANYGELFSDDAVVVDYHNGLIWKGRNKILERARRLHFTSLLHTRDGQIVLDANGEVASASTKTTFHQNRPTPEDGSGRESWQFKKINGAWKISSFWFDE